MVATLKIFVDTGGSNGVPGTSTDTTALTPSNVRLKTADDPTIDLVNPIPIPASSVNNSFWKSCFVKCTVAPNTQINNLKVYTGGTDFGTGITTKIGNQFPTHNLASTAGYKVATGVVGTSGDDMVTALYVTSYANLFSFTSGAPLTGPSISETGGNITLINHTSNYFILQV